MNWFSILSILTLVAGAAKADSAVDWQDEYSDLLGKYADSSGVDYDAWHNHQEDLERLNKVARAIAEESPEWSSREEKLAWHLNVYNALILHQVLTRYPYSNQGALKRKLFFSWASLRVSGKRVSFDNLEHGIIRPEFEEPRIHFALNCASTSCPPLLNRAYRAETLDADLTAQTRAFLNGNPEGLQWSEDEKEAKISALFSWFQADFGEVRQFINRYRGEPVGEDVKLSFLPYDWSLNQRK